MLGIFEKLRFWSNNGNANTDKPKNLITPELHEDMLAKKGSRGRTQESVSSNAHS